MGRRRRRGLRFLAPLVPKQPASTEPGFDQLLKEVTLNSTITGSWRTRKHFFDITERLDCVLVQYLRYLNYLDLRASSHRQFWAVLFFPGRIQTAHA